MIRPTECCGLRQYTGLQATPEATLLSFCDDMKRTQGGWNAAFYLFTGNTSQCIVALCEYIKKHNIGEVIHTPARRNPNSGNNVVCAIVRFNRRRLHRWFEVQSKSVAERDLFTGRRRTAFNRLSEMFGMSPQAFFAFSWTMIVIGILAFQVFHYLST